jgi:hypothetical protein
MIKAYHATSPEAFEGILEGGAILPASMRVDPEALRGACDKAISKRLEHLDVIPELKELVRAFRDLAEEKISELQGRRSLWSTQYDPKELHAHCFEYISGGTDFVYLQTGAWEDKAVQLFSRGKPWGFVFDAEELLTKGGLLFFNTLRNWIDYEMFSFRRTSDIEDAHEFLLTMIDAFFKDENNVEYGLQAIERIRIGSRSYLGWEGPLPIFMAKEIWKEGRRVHELEPA